MPFLGEKISGCACGCSGVTWSSRGISKWRSRDVSIRTWETALRQVKIVVETWHSCASSGRGVGDERGNEKGGGIDRSYSVS